MYESKRTSVWSPSDLTAIQTPTMSYIPAPATLDINNPADLEAQLVRLKERRGSDNSTTSTATCTLTSDEQQQEQHQQQNLNRTQDLDTTRPKPRTLSTYLNHTIDPSSKFILFQFLLLSLATGIIDATTFPLYSVFVSKQTGNTIFLALAALNHTSVSSTEPNIALSISLFFCSAIVFGHVGYWVGCQTRLWISISNLISTALIFAATAIRFWGGDQQDTGEYALIVIALLSIGMGAQVTMAFTVNIPNVNTTMITGVIIQLATDTGVFAKDNAARTARVAFFVAVLVGAFVGAACLSRVDASVALLVAGLVKSAVTIMFLF